MRRFLIAPLAAALLLASMIAPVGAITNGQPDGDDHPQVGQLLFFDPNYPDPRFDDPGGWFNCSGTLLSPTVVLTAGHCTFGIGHGGTDIWITFGEAPDYSILNPSASYGRDENEERYDDWSAELNGSTDWIRGTAHPHPDYLDAAFFLFDAGVVVLDEPVYGVDYATLAPQGRLDEYAVGKGRSRFTAVGYGLEYVRPVDQVGGDSRNNASLMLVDLNGVFGLGPGIAAVFSGNNGEAHQGGTCYGDSGGPIFEAGSLTIVAVTSFGVTPWCTGNGGGYRIDQPDDLTFINGYLTP